MVAERRGISDRVAIARRKETRSRRRELDQLIERFVRDVLRVILLLAPEELGTALRRRRSSGVPRALDAHPRRDLNDIHQAAGLPTARRTLAQIEREAIREALKESGGNKPEAARSLGIAVSTLYEKLKK
jgi:DNA-binding NtrC family response regulator